MQLNITERVKNLNRKIMKGKGNGEDVKILRWKCQSDKMAGKANRLSEYSNSASHIKLSTKYIINKYSLWWNYTEVVCIKGQI